MQQDMRIKTAQAADTSIKKLVWDFELEHIRIRTYHPESDGKLKRFHLSTREELGEQEPRRLGQAREIIGRWVSYYNAERLHASQLLPAGGVLGGRSRDPDEGAEGKSGARPETPRNHRPSAA